uniref:Uncharacterized protein n=1 Tax=Cacopsylla melanoneura TaxID=428564 RepID=A0A8D9DVD3_9HEMI
MLPDGKMKRLKRQIVVLGLHLAQMFQMDILGNTDINEENLTRVGFTVERKNFATIVVSLVASNEYLSTSRLGAKLFHCLNIVHFVHVFCQTFKRFFFIVVPVSF